MLDFDHNLVLFELVQVVVCEAEYSARVLSSACQTEAGPADGELVFVMSCYLFKLWCYSTTSNH